MLPIQSFSVENFKSIGPKQRVPLSKVNFLFGPNSHGKSSVLKVLGYLINGLLKKKINLNKIRLLDSSSDIFINKELINWYTKNKSFIIEYESHVNGPSTKLPIKVQLRLKESNNKILDKLMAYEQFENQEKKIFELSDNEVIINNKSSFYYLINEILDVSFEDKDPRKEFTVLKEGKDIGIYLQSLRTTGSKSLNIHELFSKTHKNKERASEIVNDIIELLLLGFGISWKRAGIKRAPSDVGLDWIGPNRTVPNKSYSIDGEKVFFDNKMLNPDSIIELNEWLKQNRELNIEYEFIVTENSSEMGSINVKEFGIKELDSNKFIPFSEIGSGISHIFQILLPFFNGVEILVIQQPEIHLHPSLQVQLSNALIKLSKEKNVQLIIETHSEHFIKAAQLEIAKSLNYINPVLTEDDLSVLYVAKDDDGFTKIKQMVLDETGAFTEPWPDDFFEISGALSLERLRNSVKSKN